MENDNFIIRDLRTTSWGWATKEIITCPEIDPITFKVYMSLTLFSNNYTQKTRVGIEKLTQTSNLSKSSIIRGIAKLEKLKAVFVIRKEGRCNEYCLLDFNYIKNDKKEKSEFRMIIDFFFEHTQKARGIKMLIKPRDTKNLSDLLQKIEDKISREQWEQLIIYFLYSDEYAKFSPDLSVFLSYKIMNALQNSLKNNPYFFKIIEKANNTNKKPDTVINFNAIESIKSELVKKLKVVNNN